MTVPRNLHFYKLCPDAPMCWDPPVLCPPHPTSQAGILIPKVIELGGRHLAGAYVMQVPQVKCSQDSLGVPGLPHTSTESRQCHIVIYMCACLH